MPRLFVAALILLLAPAACRAAEFTVDKTDDGVAVKVDGKLFADYLFKSGSKPVLWPLMGPTDKRITRAWPMEKDVPGETDKDHPHQRSMWFSHGDVNGIDFWSEGKGRIDHRELVEAEGGPQATIVTKNDWLSPDGSELICQDERRYTFHADGDRRWIDVEIDIEAADGPVVFGDTKEGSFGVRVASSMRVQQGVKVVGRIVNSEGQENLAAWGKPAAWVDYSGPVEGETLGVAIMNHPESFRFPTHWHVRVYGLFAANPFGLSDFTGGESNGEYTLPEGETLKLRYRVLLHKGDEKEGRVAEMFEQYSK